jgi:hypothetical protein
VSTILGGAILGLAAWRVFVMYWRGRPPGGDEIVQDGESVFVHIDRGKHKVIHGVSASIAIPDDLRFTLNREGPLDRIAKNFGIARELQTSDVPFDGRVYIASEDPALHDALSLRRNLRNQIFDLMRDAEEVGAADRRLWVRTGGYEDCRDDEDDVLTRQIVSNLLPSLRVLRASLVNVGGGGTEDSRDFTRAVRRWLSLAIATCVAAGIIGWFVYDQRQAHEIVNHAVWRASLWTTCGVFATFLLALFTTLGATAFTHRVLLDVLIAAVPGALLAALGGAIYVNQASDESAPRWISVPIEKSYITTSKKRETYHLVVRYWPDPSGDRHVTLSSEEYSLVQSRACVDVAWREGRLGDGWIEAFRASATQSCEGVER